MPKLSRIYNPIPPRQLKPLLLFGLLLILPLLSGLDFRFSTGESAYAQSVNANAQTNPDQEQTGSIINTIPPTPQGLHIYVNDYANLLTPEDQQLLQQRLQALDESGIAQVSVLIIPDTEQELSQFAPDIMNRWGIQHHKKQDGLLILVNARRVREHLSGNRIFVATGLALEQILPDALVGRVLDERALPAFANGDYSGGVTQTTLTLAKILAGDKELRTTYSKPAAPQIDWPTIIGLIFLLWFIFGRRNRYKGGGGFFGGYGGGFYGGGFGGGDGGGFGGGFGGGGDSGGGGGAGR